MYTTKLRPYLIFYFKNKIHTISKINHINIFPKFYQNLKVFVIVNHFISDIHVCLGDFKIEKKKERNKPFTLNRKKKGKIKDKIR